MDEINETIRRIPKTNYWYCPNCRGFYEEDELMKSEGGGSCGYCWDNYNLAVKLKKKEFSNFE